MNGPTIAGLILVALVILLTWTGVLRFAGFLARLAGWFLILLGIGGVATGQPYNGAVVGIPGVALVAAGRFSRARLDAREL